MTAEQFKAQFRFNAGRAGMVGVEREGFLADRAGAIRPFAPEILKALEGCRRFGYELSACQLEDRAGPCEIHRLPRHLDDNDRILRRILRPRGMQIIRTEVAPDNMPLDVYPDPHGRYQAITRDMPRETLLAACQVAGTHVHIGMPDAETALRTYNRVTGYLDSFCRLGDLSDGRRLEIYRRMAPDYRSPAYTDWRAFHAYAAQQKFEDDPRRCWHLIRISIHGTIEFRMFGATADNALVWRWAQACHRLCCAD